MLRYSFRDPDGGEGPWIPYREPLVMGAASGEEREYRVLLRADAGAAELERRELRIRIDKRAPAAPRISPDPGTYWEPLSVRFEQTRGDRIFYTLQGDLLQSPSSWDGNAFSVGRAGEKADFAVQAYAMDEAGNKSDIATYRYSVDAREPALDVVSPVAGTFANPQLLVLSFRNLQAVRYTIDGSDPRDGGIPYAGPVTIKKPGATVIRVAAQPRGAGRALIRKEVSFTFSPDSGTGLVLDADSGIYPKGLSPRILSVPEGTLYYALWEKTPGGSDYIAGSAIALPSVSAVERAVILRLRSLSDAGAWGAEYRYVYLLGRTGPSLPQIMLRDAEPLRGPSRVEVVAPEESLLSVSTNGSAAGAAGAAPVSSAWLDVVPKPGVSGAVVKAVAFDGFGLQSAAAERRISFDTDPGQKAVLTSVSDAPSGSALVSLKGATGVSVAFEISSDGLEPASPTSGSPRTLLPLALSVPFGVERTFKVRVAPLDSLGRLLAASDTLAVTIDRKPPPQPVLTPAPGLFDDVVALKAGSPATVYLSLTTDGTLPKDPALDAPVRDLVLRGTKEAVVSYRLKLLAVDNLGNATEVYGPYTYTVDLRSPSLPPISGIENGGRYNARALSPVLGDSPWTVRYSMTTDGSVPRDPDAKSPALTNATVFSGDDGALTTVRLKLLAVTPSGKRSGEKRELSFDIDLKSPEVPAITGVTDGGRYAQAVTVGVGQIPDDVQLFYSVSTGDAEPGDPQAGAALSSPLLFDVPEGMQRDFTLRVASRDAAGNRSLYDRRYRFTIDREPPDDPDASGAPPAGVSNRPVTLSLAARDAVVHYELTENGSIPRLPNEKSPTYGSPIVLNGRMGAAVTYRLLARSIDDLGNASRAAKTLTVLIDRTVPPSPGEPRVVYSPENPSVAYLAWDVQASGTLLYRLGAGDFTAYDGPVSVARTSDDGVTVKGEAVVENAAGTRSAATPFSRTLGKRMAAPVARGARDGGVYASRIDLRLDGQKGEVRYEVATDGSFPPTVSASSPLASGPLAFDAADGETVDVRVAARAYDPAGAAAPSEELDLAFTLDRTPPDPPVANGIEDGGYYQDDRHVALLSSEGTVYYSLSTDAAAAAPAQVDANRYKGDLLLGAKPGRAVRYGLSAYTVDAAGNRSREIKSWNVTIDQMIVYAAPSGSDRADGSRGTPVRSLSRALQVASASARKTVFLAAGDYTTDAPIAIATEMDVVGGLDAQTWSPMGLGRVSTLSPSTLWKTGSALVSISNGASTFKGVELADPAGLAPILLEIWDGTVKLEDSSLTRGKALRGQGLVVHGGSVSLTACLLQASDVKAGSLLAATGGVLRAVTTRFVGPSNADDFACIDLADARGVVLNGDAVMPGAGQRTRALRAVRSQVALNGCRLQSGAGLSEATAIDARESELSLENCDVAAGPEARSATGIASSASSLLISRSRINVSGAATGLGISARGGDFTLVRSTLKAASAAEYLCLVRLEDASATIADNILLGGNADQSMCLVSRGGAVDVLNNTVLAGTGGALTAGVIVQGDIVPRLVNNILGRLGAARGSSILLLGARNPSQNAILLSNCFGGWGQLLREEYADGRDPLEVTSVDALNALDEGAAGGGGGGGAGGVTGGAGSAGSGAIAAASRGNITEDPAVTFKELKDGAYRLSGESACVNSGTDLSTPNGPSATGPVKAKNAEVMTDFAGRTRPAPAAPTADQLPRGWDIGALESYE